MTKPLYSLIHSSLSDSTLLEQLAIHRAPVLFSPDGVTLVDIPYALHSTNPEHATVTIDAKTPGFLVWTQQAHPRWSAFVDEKGVTPQSTPGNWLQVPVNAGLHQIRFAFRPWRIQSALILFYLGMGLAFLGTLSRPFRRSHQSRTRANNTATPVGAL